MATLHTYRTGLLTLMGFLFASITMGQQPGMTTGLESVPSNAAAMLHINLNEMMQTPGMTIPTEIFAGVKQEADELFERHIGLRISELQTVTFVVPDFESLAALQTNGGQAGFGIFAFSQPVDDEFVVKNLPNTWEATKVDGENVYLDQASGLALFQNSENTIAFGSARNIEWFVESRDVHSESGLHAALELAETGHATIAFNGDQIPAEVKMHVPSEYKFLANAEYVALSLNFTNGIAADAIASFGTQDDAANAVAFAKQNVLFARNYLNQEAVGAKWEIENDNGDFFTALDPLGKLALFRYGDSLLQNTKIDLVENRFEAQLAIEGFDANMLVITCLTAVQAIGASAENEFESIAGDLESLENYDDLDALREFDGIEEYQDTEEFEELD